jgi:hypothetical protein
MFRQADNTRVARDGPISGWAQINGRLIGDSDGNAMIFFFATSHDSIRTIPVLMHDEKNPEDVNSDMEDHCADSVRYACNSRPWTAPKPKEPRPRVTTRQPTLNEVLAEYDRHRKFTGNRI